MKTQEKVFPFLIYPYLTSLLTMAGFYWKSIRSIQKYPVPIQSQMKTALQKLFCYPLAQLIIMTPTIVYVNIISFKGEKLSSLASELGELPLSLLGFFNALICLFQQKKLQTSSKSTIIVDDLDESVNSLNDESDSAESVDYKEI